MYKITAAINSLKLLRATLRNASEALQDASKWIDRFRDVAQSLRADIVVNLNRWKAEGGQSYIPTKDVEAFFERWQKKLEELDASHD